MKQIHLHGKAFNNNDFKGLVIGGQTNADTIRFVIPKTFANEIDFSSDDWTFSITYENKEGQGDTALLTKSLSAEGANIYLDWKPGQTATQVAGKLLCQIAGTKKASDEVVARFTCTPFAVYVDEWLNPDPITQTLPSVIEQALELMAEYNSDVQAAIQAGKNAAISEQNANASKNEALAAAVAADASAHIAERYAKGTEDGEPVSSGEGSQDNSKYYKELAETAKAAAQAAQADAEEAKAGAEAAKDQAEAIVTSSVTGAASSIMTKNLTANRALVSDSSGKVAVSPVTSADLETFKSEYTLSQARGGLAVGAIYWWTGKSTSLPDRALICDGTELSKTDADYAELYAIIGTIYGESADGTKFKIPDLITTADNNALGNFIRATATDDLIGSKESDAIRNIIGQLSLYYYGENIPQGAFTFTSRTETTIDTGDIKNKINYTTTIFDASNKSYMNPMAGHANGSDIHPYSIKLLPVLVY